MRLLEARSVDTASRVNFSRRMVLVGGVACAAGWHASGSYAQSSERAPEDVQRRLPTATLLGRGMLRFLGLEIYEAVLWAERSFEGSRYAAHAFALELRYARGLYGNLIAERSLKEMERSGPISAAERDRWLAFMRKTFPDVSAGDRITGFWRPKDESSEFVVVERGVAKSAVLVDREFGERFFGIWLAPTTSEPALRQTLLGTKAA
mgnify:CR=1 FL=1